jgi:hypothetical protein
MNETQAIRVTRAEFLAEPDRFLGLAQSVEVIGDSGKVSMFIAGVRKYRPSWVRLACERAGRILEPFRPRLKGPLDTSWLD